jgi:outer membrane lipoprotein SlyB
MSTENIISMRLIDPQEIIEGAAEGASAGAELGAEGGPVLAAITAAAGAIMGGLAAADSVEVTFSSHRGAPRTYRYYGEEARAIITGSDPSQFSGERVA